MPIHRYSTAGSHVILAGIGIYCIIKYTKQHSNEIDLPLIAFGVIVIHSLFGVWKWGNPDYGDKVNSFYIITYHLRDALAVSCIAGQMCMQVGYSRQLTYAHPIVSSIPFLLWILNGDLQEDLVDFLTFLNVVSCGVFAYFNDENWWGVSAAVSYLIARCSRFTDREIPDEDMRNFSLCFYCYFAYRACTGGAVASASAAAKV